MRQQVDRTALKVNQVGIVAFLLAGFVVNSVWLVAFVALVLAVGTAWPAAGLFRLAYVRALRPAGLLRPAVVDEDPAPHRFAQGVGAGCLVAALLLFLAGLPVAGWALSWLVVVLAGVNLLTGFCMGCFLHYQLARRGLIRRVAREEPA